MADVITRFRLETTQYDSKLRDAAKGLKDISNMAQMAGNGFQGFSQKSIEAARALGQTASGAITAKDKVRDLVGAYNEAAKAYNSLTVEQKQSDFGKALAGSLQQLQGRIREAKAELYGLGDAIDKTKMKGGSLGQAFDAIAGQFGLSTRMLTGVGAAAAAAGTAFKLLSDNVQMARGFEVSMSQLSSLTGKTGEDLDQLKEHAIELGSTTTLSASQVADAFKMIGSQQPQLLESSDALKEVTKSAITLAEAAGIELSTAAQTLSTSINQFGGDSSRTTEFINILAAASQKGAGDIAWLGEAITKSGTTAKAVGTDYNELVANLEMLAKSGYDASTAGTALRSIIMSLEKQANDKFKPSVVGLTQAFKNLNAAQLSLTEYQTTAGKMFAAQAKALAENADEAERLKTEITGTNTAEEQAKTNTDNLEGSLKSLASAWEGLNLHINSSNGFLRDCVDGLTATVAWVDKLIQKLNQLPESPEAVITRSLPETGSNVDERGNYIKRPAQKGAAGFDWNKGEWKPGYGGAIYNSTTGQTELAEVIVNGQKREKPTPTKKKSGGSSSTKTFDISKIAFNAPDASGLKPEEIMGPSEMWEKYRDAITGCSDAIADFSAETAGWTKNFDPVAELLKKDAVIAQQVQKANEMAASAVSSLGAAFASLDDPAAKAAGIVMQAIASIALGFAQASVQAASMGPFAWIAYLAAGAAAMATTISTIHSLTGYANGGIVDGRGGGFVGGTAYSGDNVGNVRLDSGELVLNRAQQNNLANSLNDGSRNLHLTATVRGEQLEFAINSSLRRRGRGELVTWK